VALSDGQLARRERTLVPTHATQQNECVARAPVDIALDRDRAGIPAADARGMHAAQPIGIALEESVGDELRKLKKRLKKARRGDSDGIHDARTELRRVREELTVMGETVFDRPETERLGQRLHRVEKALADPRDADVMLESLRAYARTHQAERCGLLPLEKLLKRRRERSLQRAVKRFGRARRSVRATTRLVRKGQVPALRAPKASPHLVAHFVHETIWRAYDQVLAYERARTRDYEVLHAFRSACRRLRYTMELFEGALPGAERLIAELERTQDEIGDMHDGHVATTRIERWLRKGKLRRTPELLRFVEAQKTERDAQLARCLERRARILGGEFRATLVHTLDPALREDRGAKGGFSRSGARQRARP
jgi:CHAD domain-containing protein